MDQLKVDSDADLELFESLTKYEIGTGILRVFKHFISNFEFSRW